MSKKETQTEQDVFSCLKWGAASALHVFTCPAWGMLERHNRNGLKQLSAMEIKWKGMAIYFPSYYLKNEAHCLYLPSMCTHTEKHTMYIESEHLYTQNWE